MQLPTDETEKDEGTRYPEWKKLYQQALIEVDQTRLGERIAAAETAISNRLRAIDGNSHDHTERQAIEDALSSLRILKRDLH
ncbi:MAG: hypothetical protein WBW53_15960 [Terriglobales bacterium]